MAKVKVIYLKSRIQYVQFNLNDKNKSKSLLLIQGDRKEKSLPISFKIIKYKKQQVS